MSYLIKFLELGNFNSNNHSWIFLFILFLFYFFIFIEIVDKFIHCFKKIVWKCEGLFHCNFKRIDDPLQWSWSHYHKTENWKSHPKFQTQNQLQSNPKEMNEKKSSFTICSWEWAKSWGLKIRVWSVG